MTGRSTARRVAQALGMVHMEQHTAYGQHAGSIYVVALLIYSGKDMCSERGLHSRVGQ